MTYQLFAKNVLEDCRTALAEFERTEPAGSLWRVQWVANVALLRAEADDLTPKDQVDALPRHPLEPEASRTVGLGSRATGLLDEPHAPILFRVKQESLPLHCDGHTRDRIAKAVEGPSAHKLVQAAHGKLQQERRG